MAEIVNLRLKRKQAARDARRQAAAEKAARHGENASEVRLRRARAEKAARTLDAHRREDSPEAT